MSRQQSVTELELAFAQNPDSTAYVDLCLAYIDQGRFMEAMVVCKKGIKAHPESVQARVLLAKVYAAQKKYKRALQELDELAQAMPNRAEVLVARGKMRFEAGEDAGGIEDLKKAIDLDPKAAEATAFLAEKGIEYPERPKPPPEPARPPSLPPPVPLSTGAPPMMPPAGSVSGPGITVTPIASTSTPRVISEVGRAIPVDAAGQAGVSLQAFVDASGRPVSISGGQQYVLYQAPVRQKLEGEDELEALANQVAEERPSKGKLVTSVLLAIALVVSGAGVTAYRFHEKKKVEAIDALTQQATALFNEDTYGSYKMAAEKFDEILTKYDSGHNLTLGRLAHTYAILWGEHGDTELKARLDQVLSTAQSKAPDVSHTQAARALVALYDGKDRQANAAKARDILAPFIAKVHEGDGATSYADLAMGIIDLELGNYESATEMLGNVKQVLPGSVRAKVWHARAALRAGRYGTAEAAFLEALRAKPGHPGARAGLALVKVVRGDLQGAAENILKFDELPQKEISSRDAALAEFARSEVFRAAGEDAKAMGAYENAVRFDPGNADFPYGLGRSLLNQDRAKEALAPLKKAVDMEKTRVQFLVTLAEAQMQLDDYKAAEQHIDQAIKRATKSTGTEAALAKARLLRRTKSPETEAYLKKLLGEYPSAEAEIDLELGRYYRALQKTDEAKSALEKAIQKMSGQPPLKQGEIVLSYGKLLEDRREMEPAIKSYRQAGDLGNIEAWFWLSQALSRGSRDDRADAKKACERYLAAGASLRYTADARRICESIR